MSLIQNRVKNVSAEKENNEYKVTRKQLLLTCVGVATSNHSKIKNILIAKLSEQLGTITGQDYQYMAGQIYGLPKEYANDVNHFLSKYLDGYAKRHEEFYAMYYM